MDSRALTAAFALALVTAWVAPAAALKPSKHSSITKTSCRDAGLPRDFCDRAALENYNTDANEWDDMTAHAQTPAGATTCEGADLAVARASALAGELHAALIELARAPTDDAAIDAGTALGRATHLVQDQCAHQGMPNPQHAWYSMSDFCGSTHLSPDVQDAAFTCARAETDALMQDVATAVSYLQVAGELGPRSCRIEDDWDSDGTTRAPCEENVLPAPWDVCSFLSGASDWDGRDARWNPDRVGAALDAALDAALAGVAQPPAPLCAEDTAALAPATTEPAVDVEGGTPSCPLVHLLCLGKADSGAFFAEDTGAAAEPVALGCQLVTNAPPGHGAGTAFAWLAALVLVIRRRYALTERA